MLVKKAADREWKATDYPGIERSLFRNNETGGRSSVVRLRQRIALSSSRARRHRGGRGSRGNGPHRRRRVERRRLPLHERRRGARRRCGFRRVDFRVVAAEHAGHRVNPSKQLAGVGAPRVRRARCRPPSCAHERRGALAPGIGTRTAREAAPVAASPLVTVIVRSMDRPELDCAVMSIARQDHPAIETIVVDATGGHHRPLAGSAATTGTHDPDGGHRHAAEKGAGGRTRTVKRTRRMGRLSGR